jgi:hypothetical protein
VAGARLPRQPSTLWAMVHPSQCHPGGEGATTWQGPERPSTMSRPDASELLSKRRRAGSRGAEGDRMGRAASPHLWVGVNTLTTAPSLALSPTRQLLTKGTIVTLRHSHARHVRGGGEGGEHEEAAAATCQGEAVRAVRG